MGAGRRSGVKWSPPWAKHVAGEWTPNDEGDPIHIRLSCVICGDESRTVCTQGLPRTQVSRYALLHMHGKEVEKWLSGK